MEEGLYEIVLNKVQDFLKTKGIEIVSEETLMKALPLVIECVESFKNKGITGSEKKNLAIRVLLFIVNASKIDDSKKQVLQNLVDGGTLDTTIDIIIDASKGKFELNRKNKRKLFACLGSCLTNLGTSGDGEEPRTPTPLELKNIKIRQTNMV